MIWEILIIGLLNIACFFLGASIRQKVDTNVKIEPPKLPSVKKTLEEKRIEKEQKIEMDKYQKVLDNINNYPYNQQKID